MAAAALVVAAVAVGAPAATAQGRAQSLLARMTLDEIELPAFRPAVRAGVGSLMCSDNKVNGTYACENDTRLNGILRRQWGFGGWVMSDWGATHSTAAILSGLDMEMLTGTFFGDPLKVVENGSIPASAVDRAVLRILRRMERFGLLDRTPPARPRLDPRGANAVAQRVAEDGAVLLRNAGRLLPLRGRQADSIAVIGATAPGAGRRRRLLARHPAQCAGAAAGAPRARERQGAHPLGGGRADGGRADSRERVLARTAVGRRRRLHHAQARATWVHEDRRLRAVRIHLAKRRLQHWDAARDRWVLGRGSPVVSAGSSSDDLPLRRRVVIG